MAVVSVTAYRRTHSSSWLAWSQNWWPLGS